LLAAVSDDEVRQGLDQGIHAAYAVIPNGIRVPTTEYRSPSACRELAGDSERPTVVCLGRLCEQKGQDRLLEAWPGIQARVPTAELIFVGDGPNINQLRKQSTTLRGVRFVGATRDVYRWLSIADVVVLPSRWEAGVPLAFMEAMAAGRCVVATEFQGIGNGMPPGAGEVVPQGDPRALTAAVVARLTDTLSAERERRLAWHIARRLFDRRGAAERMARAYRGIVEYQTGADSETGSMSNGSH
jgi:glycosyltransferase involved in cell wall biosynthesis